MENIKNKIISKANNLGFQKIGFSEAKFYNEDQERLFSWINKDYHGQMEWINKRKEERANVLKYFPEVKTIISFAYNYFSGLGSNKISDDFKFSNYAWGDDYHLIIKKYLNEVVDFMKTILGDFDYRICVDTSPIMERQWAARSGIGWIGKNTNLITRDYGSWLFLAEILIDNEIKSDPIYSEDLCGTCTACIDECPTNAIVEPYMIDSNKCISYLTIEHKGDIPNDKKDSLDNWIYGCDVCQEVCPWNIKFGTETKDNHFHPREEIKKRNAVKDWNISKEEFSQIFKQSAVKRTKYEGFKRNLDLVK